MNKMMLAVTVLALTLTTVQAQDEKPADPAPEKKTESGVKLDWNFTKGTERKYRQTQSMTQSMDLGRGASEVVSDTTTWYTEKCLGFTEDGAVHLQYTYDRIHAKLSAPSIEFDYDSADPDESQLEAVPAMRGTVATAGHTFEYELTLEYEVRKLIGWEKIRELILKDFEQELAAQMAPTLSDENMTNQLEAQYRGLSPKPVAKGDTWVWSQVVPAGLLGSATYEHTVKLDEFKTENESHTAHMSSEGKMKFQKSDDPTYADWKISYSDVSIKGSMVWDVKGGMMRHSKQENSMTMVIDYGAQLTQKIKAVAELELLPEAKPDAKPEPDANPKD